MVKAITTSRMAKPSPPASRESRALRRPRRTAPVSGRPVPWPLRWLGGVATAEDTAEVPTSLSSACASGDLKGHSAFAAAEPRRGRQRGNRAADKTPGRIDFVTTYGVPGKDRVVRSYRDEEGCRAYRVGVRVAPTRSIGGPEALGAESRLSELTTSSRGSESRSVTNRSIPTSEPCNPYRNRNALRSWPGGHGRGARDTPPRRSGGANRGQDIPAHDGVIDHLMSWSGRGPVGSTPRT